MPQTIPVPPVVAAPAPHVDLFPAGGDNTGRVGTAGLRWNEIRGVNVEAGDLTLKAQDGSAEWKLIEAPDGIRALNILTGENFRLALLPEESPK